MICWFPPTSPSRDIYSTIYLNLDSDDTHTGLLKCPQYHSSLLPWRAAPPRCYYPHYRCCWARWYRPVRLLIIMCTRCLGRPKAPYWRCMLGKSLRSWIALNPLAFSNAPTLDISRSILTSTATCSSGISRTVTSQTDNAPSFGWMGARDVALWMAHWWKSGPTDSRMTIR